MRIPPRLNKALDWVSARRNNPSMVVVPTLATVLMVTAIAAGWWVVVSAVAGLGVGAMAGYVWRGGPR